MSERVVKIVCLLMSVILFITLASTTADSGSFVTTRSSKLRKARESENSMNCNCQRESKWKFIGNAVGNGERIEIDIGRCKKRCSATRHLKKKQFQRLLKENPSLDPVEVYKIYSVKNTGGEASCRKGKSCEASQSRVEKVITEKGTATVTVTEKCACQEGRRHCRRYTRMVTLHKGTPLEVTVDIGTCRGHCRREFNCHPIETRTISIEGPNGAECVAIVEDCSCSSPCYKMSHYQQYYDYSEGLQAVKVIDVGRCVGSCREDREDHCVQRDDERKNCLMSLVSTTECKPFSTNTAALVEVDGAIKNISTISYCQCF